MCELEVKADRFLCECRSRLLRICGVVATPLSLGRGVSAMAESAPANR